MGTLVGSLSPWFIPQRMASCSCFTNSCSCFTNSCSCFTWYPSRFSKARGGTIWTHFSSRIGPWARLYWNPSISSNIWHQNIRFVRFCQFLDFQKKPWQRVPSGHTLKKESVPWWQICAIHGFVRILQYYSKVRNVNFVFILFYKFRNFLLNFIVRGHHLEHLSKKVSSMVPIHRQTPLNWNLQENPFITIKLPNGHPFGQP